MRFRYILISSLLVLLNTSCSKNNESSVNIGDVNTILKITLADATQPVFTLIYIAETKGYFKDVGLDINYLNFTSGRDALNSVIEGKADIATVYETPVVINAIKGVPIRIISTLHSSDNNTALLVRKDHGINTISDLAGKKIAVPFYTNADFFLTQLLANNQLSNQVKLINVRPQDIPLVFAKGSVDAVAVWNPNLYKAKKSVKAENVKVFTSDFYSETSMLVSLKDKVTTLRIAYLRLLVAIKRAEIYLMENPVKSKQLTIEYLQGRFDANTINAIWNDFEAEVLISNSLINLLTQEAQWLIATDDTKTNMPNFDEIIDNTLLFEVDPSTVLNIK